MRRVHTIEGRPPRVRRVLRGFEQPRYRADGHGPVRFLDADRAPQHIDGRPLRVARVPIGSYNVERGAGVVLTPSLNTGTLTFLDRAAHDACVFAERPRARRVSDGPQVDAAASSGSRR